MINWALAEAVPGWANLNVRNLGSRAGQSVKVLSAVSASSIFFPGMVHLFPTASPCLRGVHSIDWEPRHQGPYAHPPALLLPPLPLSSISHTQPMMVCVCAQSLQFCPTLCDIMDWSPHPHPQAPLSMRILQARILQWVAMPSSRGSSQSRDRTQVSHTAGRFFTVWATREALANDDLMQNCKIMDLHC